jgi:hypothetical protein
MIGLEKMCILNRFSMFLNEKQFQVPIIAAVLLQFVRSKFYNTKRDVSDKKTEEFMLLCYMPHHLCLWMDFERVRLFF